MNDRTTCGPWLARPRLLNDGVDLAGDARREHVHWQLVHGHAEGARARHLTQRARRLLFSFALALIFLFFKT